jgi:DNA-directed RNA polymerase subunit H (RpoH/RPB5)
VWGNDLVSRCVRDRFVLWHADADAAAAVDDDEEEAKKVLGYYNIPHDKLPVVVVVDPVTGQAMDVLHGSAACELNDFMVRLGPFTETKPTIPVVMAARKSTTSASAGAQSNTRPATTSTTTTTPPSSGRAAGSRQQAPTTTTVMRKQPDAVVAAVAPTCQTRQEQAPTTTATTEPAVAPCTGQPQPESVEEKVCKVRLRLVDGRVVTKEFGSQCAVAALFAYCRSMLGAGGAPPETPFRLLRFVGRAAEEIGDQNASFESLGLHLTTVSVHLG